MSIKLVPRIAIINVIMFNGHLVQHEKVTNSYEYYYVIT